MTLALLLLISSIKKDGLITFSFCG